MSRIVFFDLDVDCRGEWLGFSVDQPQASLQRGDEIEKREKERGEKKMDHDLTLGMLQ